MLDSTPGPERRWNLAIMLYSIIEHCRILLSSGELFLDRDLIQSLQHFDLAACLTFGEYGSHEWWNRTVRPAITFIEWLIYIQTVCK